MTTSNDEIETRQLTVRLPATLLSASKRLARRRRTSVNGLIRSLLEDVSRAERERELRRTYDELGADTEADVERYRHAQREVVRRGR